MCGIAGKIVFNAKSVKLNELKAMSKAIAHRGPDDEGFYISPNGKTGLVNRRLAIIDLSKKGHQPMTYKNRYVITYNGEVYNFQSEREKLRKIGYRFKSGADTEVILALYDKYRTGCLTHLRGMFAFALYDAKENTVFIARDRIGKKPLKYYLDENVFIFASELKAILTQKEVVPEPDYLAIHNYLTYGYVPSPNTGFMGISKLEPGTYLILNTKNKKLALHKYWQPDFSQKLNLSEGEWCKRILKELEEATRLRMIADVPVGAFLSGGVDSSGVVATMARLSKNPIKTFTVGFSNKKDDERPHAERIAKKYHTDHQILIAKPEAIENILPSLVYQYEEPYADSSAVVTYMICKLARKFVTVVLNGDGGDENFAGYDNRVMRLNRDVSLSKYLQYLRPLGLPLTSYLANNTSHAFWIRADKFLKKTKMDIADRYVTYNCFFNNINKSDIYSRDFKNKTLDSNSYEVARSKFALSKTSNPQDQALFCDLTNWLPDSQLTKIDIASMATSLETRSPFLDHKFTEFAAKIPYDLKLKGSNGTKYILKKALEKIVPKENLYKKKMGFTIPLDRWFKGKLNKYAESKILGKKSKTKKLFDTNAIKIMLKEHSIDNDFGSRLWALLTLELWFENYFD